MLITLILGIAGGLLLYKFIGRIALFIVAMIVLVLLVWYVWHNIEAIIGFLIVVIASVFGQIEKARLKTNVLGTSDDSSETSSL